MIKDRPSHLLEQDYYKKLPAKPFGVRFDALPSSVREALGPLGGIQPVTRAMAKAANGRMYDVPCEAEIKLFKEKGTLFQPIFLVLSIAHLKDDNGTDAMPYALSLMPTSKRGVADEKSIELVAKLDVQKLLNETEPCYTHFDPFTGKSQGRGEIQEASSEAALYTIRGAKTPTGVGRAVANRTLPFPGTAGTRTVAYPASDHVRRWVHPSLSLRSLAGSRASTCARSHHRARHVFSRAQGRGVLRFRQASRTYQGEGKGWGD
jgi:hypothetical protein